MCRSQAFVPQDSCSFSTRNRTGRDALPNKRGKRVRAGSEAVASLRPTPAFAIAVPYFNRVLRRHRLFSSDILVDSRELVPLMRIRDRKRARKRYEVRLTRIFRRRICTRSYKKKRKIQTTKY